MSSGLTRSSATDFIQISSGLLTARPQNVIVLPVLFEGQVKAVIELAALTDFTASHLAFLEQLTGSIGIVLGLVSGYFGGWVDNVLMRCMDVLLAFPAILLAVTIMALLGPSTTNGATA